MDKNRWSEGATYLKRRRRTYTHQSRIIIKKRLEMDMESPSSPPKKPIKNNKCVQIVNISKKGSEKHSRGVSL